MTTRRFTQSVHLPSELKKAMVEDSIAGTKQFYFILAASVHSELASLTPVLTGYLRYSMSARTNDQAPSPPKPKTERAAGAYQSSWGEADSVVKASIAAFGPGKKWEIGYWAEYAPYVEDRYHMVKTVKAKMTSLVKQAAAAVRAMRGG